MWVIPTLSLATIHGTPGSLRRLMAMSPASLRARASRINMAKCSSTRDSSLRTSRGCRKKGMGTKCHGWTIVEIKSLVRRCLGVVGGRRSSQGQHPGVGLDKSRSSQGTISSGTMGAVHHSSGKIVLIAPRHKVDKLETACNDEHCLRKRKLRHPPLHTEMQTSEGCENGARRPEVRSVRRSFRFVGSGRARLGFGRKLALSAQSFGEEADNRGLKPIRTTSTRQARDP